MPAFIAYTRQPSTQMSHEEESRLVLRGLERRKIIVRNKKGGGKTLTGFYGGKVAPQAENCNLFVISLLRHTHTRSWLNGWSTIVCFDLRKEEERIFCLVYLGISEQKKDGEILLLVASISYGEMATLKKDDFYYYSPALSRTLLYTLNDLF